MPVYPVNPPPELERKFLEVLGNWHATFTLYTVNLLFIELFALTCDPLDLIPIVQKQDAICVKDVQENRLYWVELVGGKIKCHMETRANGDSDTDSTSGYSQETFAVDNDLSDA